MWQVGDRIELVAMPDDPNPVRKGTRGTVREVMLEYPRHDQTVLAVDWDDGRTLNVVLPLDQIKLVAP
jgi:hypothetical protein